MFVIPARRISTAEGLVKQESSGYRFYGAPKVLELGFARVKRLRKNDPGQSQTFKPRT